jgi:hypothetical protein
LDYALFPQLISSAMLQALDTVFSDGRYAALAKAVDAKAAVLREHIYREVEQPVLVLIE